MYIPQNTRLQKITGNRESHLRVVYCYAFVINEDVIELESRE